MCIPCDWLLLGDVTNSLLKRNKPSIFLSTCRVVYTLLVSSSCGSLYQCDFKTYSLVCHVQMLVVTHKQTDKRTDTQNDKTLSMCLHCGRPQHCLCHLSSLLISWCWWYFRLAATVTANYHNHDIRQGERGRLVSCHTPLKQADSSGVFVQHLGFFVEPVVAVFSVDGGVGVLTDNDINHSDSLVIAVLQSRDW